MKILFCLLAIFFSVDGFTQTQYEMNEKEANNYKVKDAELNKVYKRLISLLELPKEKEMLIKAQRNWILYRDAHCAFTESAYEGGSMQPMVYFGCMTEITNQRIKELKALIEERSPR